MAVPKLRFKEFDGDWSNKKIGNIASKVGSGSTPRGGAEAYTDHGIIFIRSQNVNNDQLLLDDVAYIPEETHVKMSGSKVIANDILLNITGASIGRSCVVPHDFTEANVNQHVCIIRTPNDDPIFVQSFLSSENGQNAIQSKQAGGGREGLNFQAIRSIDFHFPPSKAEQTKIASFLSAVDEKISQLTQKHELLSQYKQGMMQKLFSQQLRFKADDGSEFGEWEEIKLTDFLKFTPRPIEKPNTNYHALGVRSHFKGLFNKFDSEPNKISMDTLYRVKRNDVVVNITFAWEGAMAIAEKEHDEGLVSHRFPTYLCDDSKINLHFFKYRFIQKDFLSALQLCSPGGAGRNRVLNKSAFLEISFSKPTLEEQTKIANFLSAIDQKIEVVAQQIEQAKTWKKGLLQQMFV